MTKHHNNPKHLFSFLATCVAVVLLFSGCSTFDTGDASAKLPGQTSAPIIGTYSVQMANRFGEVEEYTGDIDGSVTVEAALQRSGALKRNRGMEIVVLRKLAKSPRPLRLEVDYTKSEGVSSSQNYALHPGDTIVIQPAGRDLVGGIISSIAPGLSK